MTLWLRLTCRDPLISRDSRPFGAGSGTRMRSLPWVLPSVVAGSARSTIAKSQDIDFDDEVSRKLLAHPVAGFFPVVGDELYLPAPADCFHHPSKGVLPVGPVDVGHGGCDFPVGHLRPVALTPDQAEEDSKPESVPGWWPMSEYLRWLGKESVRFDDRFLLAPESDPRTHVSIDPALGSAKDQMLFSTTGLPLTHMRRYGVGPDRPGRDRVAEISLALRLAGELAPKSSGWNALHPLGGERRLVHWASDPGLSGLWSCPEPHRRLLSRSRVLRMILVTPAIFSHGWKPAWLGENLEGTPPGTSIRVRLRAAAIGRWKAVSGWNLRARPGHPIGPKAIRRMVQAGGVYFFDRVDDAEASPADGWLLPVSDDVQDRNDGFGLVVWGV